MRRLKNRGEFYSIVEERKKEKYKETHQFEEKNNWQRNTEIEKHLNKKTDRRFKIKTRIINFNTVEAPFFASHSV